MHQKKALEILYSKPTVQVEICYHSNEYLLLKDDIGQARYTNLLESSIFEGKPQIYKF